MTPLMASMLSLLLAVAALMLAVGLWRRQRAVSLMEERLIRARNAGCRSTVEFLSDPSKYP